MGNRISVHLHELIKKGVQFEQICKTCGVVPETVGRWMGDGKPPEGETMIRLLYLCWQYEVYPNDFVPNPVIMALAKAFVTGSTTGVDLAKDLDYGSMSRYGNDTIYRVLMGKHALTPEKMALAKELIAQKGWKNVEKAVLAPVSGNANWAKIKALLEELTRTLGPFDVGSAESRVELRQKVGAGLVFVLSNILNGLTSEETHRIVHK